jgi:hypothetical protein
VDQLKIKIHPDVAYLIGYAAGVTIGLLAWKVAAKEMRALRMRQDRIGLQTSQVHSLLIGNRWETPRSTPCGCK